ncbi:MAG: sigma 54-interacting transcriptional regulator [Deltaproteobacteria bacterium]|nr:sigma 54-interacting transcriptional regulator [Deltaproteobacteria bacterium]
MTATEVGALDPLVGRFRLRHWIGGDALRFAARAQDTNDGSSAVLKFEAPGGLLREYVHLTRLTHPHIARVVEVGQIQSPLMWSPPQGPGPIDLTGRLYLATADVGGISLQAWRTLAAPSVGDVVRLATELGDALAYVHSRHLVHGDVTPANVVIDNGGRAVLVDFGLSRAAGGGAGQGTAGFAAPEALLGQVTARSDLFGLGATLYFAWTGQPPFGEGTIGVARMLAAGDVKPPSLLREGLPPWLNELIVELLQITPSQRPASARHVVQRIRKAMPASDDDGLRAALASRPIDSGDPLAGVFVGREAERQRLVQVLSALAQASNSHQALVFTGMPGSGRHALWTQALADHRLGALARGESNLRVTTATALLASHRAPPLSDPARAAASRRAQLLSAADAIAEPVCVLLDADGEDAASLLPWWPLLQQACTNKCLFVMFAPAATPVPQGALAVAASPLGEAEITNMLQAAGSDVDAKLVANIIGASGGNAALVSLLVRRCVAGEDVVALSASAAHDVFAQDFATLPPNAANAVLACWWSLEATEVECDTSTAIARGWLQSNGNGGVQLPLGAQSEALWNVTAVGPSAQLLARAAVVSLPSDDPRRAAALRLCGYTCEAFDAFLAAARSCWQRAQHAQAERWWTLADAVAGADAFPPADATKRAQTLALLGRYAAAESWLTNQPASGSPAAQVMLAETAAWLARRQGDLPKAVTVLQNAQSLIATETAFDPTEAALASARLAAQRCRVAIAAGKHEEALALAQKANAGDPETLRLVDECRALCLAYLGRADEAKAAVVQLQARLSAQIDDESIGRTFAISGIAAQFRHDLQGAQAAYDQAITAYEKVGDVHGHANARLNLAMVLSEQGRYSEALQAFGRAFDDLLRVGAFGDANAAAFNAGLLFARLRDQAAVRAALGRISRAALALGENAPLAWLASLEGTAAWHAGEFAASAAHHAEAAQAFARNSDPLSSSLAWLASAEAHAEAGATEAATLAVAHTSQANVDVTQVQWINARLSLRSGAADLQAARRLRDEATSDANNLRRPRALRSAILAARLFAALGNAPESEQCFALAHRMQEEIKMHSPAAHHAALDADPDAVWLGSWRAQNNGASSGGAVVQMAERLASAQARLRRFVRLSKRLNSELRLPRLLETVLDTIIELTEAERGFLLLRDAQGDLVVRAARNIEQTSLEGAALAFSRSIAEQVARTGSPVITVDAADDARFRQALSVSDLQLRSVVAVPLTIKGQVEGTIYVDNRLRQGAFGEADASTLLDFAELAALAIGNARLVSELQRRDRQIESLNRRLEKDLAARKEEISSMRVELSESRETFALRFDYNQIIGRSPRMMELLRLLDRVSETNLPVIIQGESGTGKELVARALVANGPRKAKAFVTENCAAIPETLLESTLFGYTRGAFTGADRDTRGLFAIANEGTLFLDEVGEMSPALQGKLLRVLQEGEYRRVGGQRSEKTDVRLIVATNKDLAAMVASGQFRQDLFYRLAVVRVQLPPLRDRAEDIPLLVRHFLSQWKEKAGVRARHISSDALSRLCAYRWPGNVRELENELGRATAFAGETIEVSDLSPHLASPMGPALAPSLDAEDMDLKLRVERLEKGLLREALSKFDGNQTRAAQALGLSRFGLQKKMRRYGFAASS